MRYLNLETLHAACIFFNIQPLVWTNGLLMFEKYRKQILLHQIETHLSIIQNEDIKLDYEKIDKLDEETMNTTCLDRGIEINNIPWIEKIKDLKIWVMISNEEDVNSLFLLLSWVFDYSHRKFD